MDYRRGPRWLAAVLQSQMISRVPLAVDAPGSSRQRPDCAPTSEPLGPEVHCWLPPPVHVHSSTPVPLAVPPAVTSRQRPFSRSVRSGITVHRCAADTLQSHRSTVAPAAAEEL